MNQINLFLLSVIAILASLTVQSYAQAFIAERLGDKTLKNNGRLTLNPVAHFDLIGFILLSTIGIGWAKKLDLKIKSFKNKRDYALTIFSGPLANLLLAFLLAVPYKYLGSISAISIVHEFIAILFNINLVLFVINLLPVPPMALAYVLRTIVPLKFEERYVNYLRRGQGFFIVFLLVDVFLNQAFGFSVLGQPLATLFNLVEGYILIGT